MIFKVLFFTTGLIGAIALTRLPSSQPVEQVAPVAAVQAAVVVEEQTDGVLAPINEYRASQGLPAVRLDAKLNESAQAKAEHLTTHSYWAHVAPDGTTPWQFIKDAGYSYRQAGETLARCFDSGAAVVDGWIASPTHEAELSGDYEDIGLGVATGEDGCEYVVAHFGRKL